MRLPAEWEPQQLVLFAFPRRGGDWGDHLTAASAAMIQAANLVNGVTPVLLIVADTEHFSHYADDFEGEVLELTTDDCWIRDYGPITVFTPNKEPVFLDFTFNGWGGKFAATKDNQLTARLLATKFPGVTYQKVDLVLEGGSIDSDGMGTLLTTTTCLLSAGRNNWSEPEKAEQILRQYFGKRTDLYWLTDGELIGDDTDAHVDTLARFLDERTIAYASCENPKDPHFASLNEMKEDLKLLRTPHHKAYKLLSLPLPPPIYGADGHRLPATYANFLISNGHLFLPTYFDAAADDHPGRAADEKAISILREHGKYEVVPVPCRPFLEQHGSLHCLTMQIPL
ncbi:MAG: agmatine deiminase family protein, partial [Bacteroidota bacterium]